MKMVLVTIYIIEIICWIVYNAYLKSIIGILSQSALFVSAICGLVIYYVHKHKKNLFTEEVNENKNSN